MRTIKQVEAEAAKLRETLAELQNERAGYITELEQLKARRDKLALAGLTIGGEASHELEELRLQTRNCELEVEDHDSAVREIAKQIEALEAETVAILRQGKLDEYEAERKEFCDVDATELNKLINAFGAAKEIKARMMARLRRMDRIANELGIEQPPHRLWEKTLHRAIDEHLDIRNWYISKTQRDKLRQPLPELFREFDRSANDDDGTTELQTGTN